MSNHIRGDEDSAGLHNTIAELKTENRRLKKVMLSSHQITRVIIQALERDNTPVRLEMAAELKACLAKSCELLEEYEATS